ncbi:hypothetical protein O3Q52_43445 [Streptomyces sp. ActVer]|uniref:hypothetical protein n=1 Tax=Streptomyces sp. ActVer TaxID=3014558 RepID=UPI0022B496AD|nr:hypothetical protein [Streptomyces sp. ActVer]MCZ4514860.1 hypothetical protein [Streptomyces sp. ActVer]
MSSTSRRTAAALAALALAGTLAAGCAASDSTSRAASSRAAAAPSPSSSDCWRSGTSGDDWNDWDSWGPGMGPGMMDRDDCSWGPGMMGGHYWQRGDGTPVKTLDQARQRADAFADRLDLHVGEVMQFSKNFYAELETPSGRLATEILVDPADGDTGIEYGPAMMWNTDYGMHHGGQTQTRISPDQAQNRAQQWLRDRGSNLSADEAEAFPGYYTLRTLRSGKINGMLSVNASTGAVWDHTWHGTYTATSEH